MMIMMNNIDVFDSGYQTAVYYVKKKPGNFIVKWTLFFN